MEKDVNSSNTEETELAIGPTEESANRQENTEALDSLPGDEEANSHEAGEENSPPGEEEDPSAESSALEAQVTELELRLQEAESQRSETEGMLAETRKSLAEAVSSYRTLLLESTPEAPESMVVGETVDEVDRSFAEAKALVQQVRREVEEKLAKERLPAGSPTRGPADFSALTSMEKIRSALAG